MSVKNEPQKTHSIPVETCTKCNKAVKNAAIQSLGINDFFQVFYCPRCETISSVEIPLPLCRFTGIARSGIDIRDGHFILRVDATGSKNDMTIRTFPQDVISTPSEWQSYSSLYNPQYTSLDKTPERTARVYPELKRGDKVSVVGFWKAGELLMSTILINESINKTTYFLDDQIKLKKSFLRSFNIKNPLITKSEELMDLS